jgi:hypothetical protein
MVKETVIAEHESLILTPRFLVKEKKSIGRHFYAKMPLDKLDSIVALRKINILFFVIGLILLLAGVYFLYGNGFELTILNFSLMFLGVIVLIYVFITVKEYVEFRSSTITLREERAGAKKFVDTVSEHIYENNNT